MFLVHPSNEQGSTGRTCPGPTDWSGGTVTTSELHVMRRKALAHWHPDKRESWKCALPPPRMEDFRDDDQARYLFTAEYYVRLYSRQTSHNASGHSSPLSYSIYLGQLLTQCSGDLDRAETLLSEPSTLADIEDRENAAGQVPTMRARMLARLRGIRELAASRAEAKAKAPGGVRRDRPPCCRCLGFSRAELHRLVRLSWPFVPNPFEARKPSFGGTPGVPPRAAAPCLATHFPCELCEGLVDRASNDGLE
jgi:hypothetical protein